MICATSPTTLRELYDDAYRPIRLVGRSPRTLQAYDAAISLWQRFPQTAPLIQINTRLIAQFAEWLLSGRSAATVNSYVKRIMVILRFASEEEEIGNPPRWRKLRESKRVPLALTEAEFLKVLAIAEREPGQVGGIPAPAWWRSLLPADWESGLRLRALLSIASRDVLCDQNGFYCQAENQKDREAAWYPLSPATMELIRAIFDPERELLWPHDVCATTIGRRFRRMLDDSGIYAPKGAGMAFHRIRKSTASYIKAAGGDAQQKLGHSSPSVTERYLDPRIVHTPRQTVVVPAPHASPERPDAAKAGIADRLDGKLSVTPKPDAGHTDAA